jgi:hypothetical protein
MGQSGQAGAEGTTIGWRNFCRRLLNPSLVPHVHRARGASRTVKEQFMAFSEAELAEAIEQIAFDFFHFRFYWRHLHDNKCSKAAHQALLYALLLHFRLLWDFFYGTPQHDDCVAGDFRVFPKFQNAFPSQVKAPDGGKDLAVNLNKRLAHFTATRWGQTGKPPMKYYEDFFPDIDALITKFQNALPEELQESLVKTMRKWENDCDGVYCVGVQVTQ